jgi:hypothetical protein
MTLCLLAAWIVPQALSAQPVSEPRPAPEEPTSTSKEQPASEAEAAASQQESTESEETTQEAEATQDSEDAQREEKEDDYSECDQFIAAYMRSASRKLFRALQGHDYKLRPIELQEWLDIEVGQGDGPREVSFDVLREKESLVVSLVDSERAYRNTFVAALTTDGPVIARFEWPSVAAVEQRGEACRPTRSKIERPSAPLSKIVDIEPFKFWGLRVVWRLPSKFKGSGSNPKSAEGRGALYSVLVDVVGAK